MSLTAVHSSIRSVETRLAEIEYEKVELGKKLETLRVAASIRTDNLKPADLDLAARHLFLVGEVDYEPQNAWRFDDYRPGTRRRLLDEAIKDVAKDSYCVRSCKTYDRWYDQVCNSANPRHGSLTFAVITRNWCQHKYGLTYDISDKARDAIVAVLVALRDGVITTEQFNAYQKSLKAAG
jgi:hypothetical protein